MILVTGATGLSGHFVVREFQQRGYAVRGLARASSASKLQVLGVDVAIGDLAGLDTLRQALAFQPGWTWQQTVAASVALAADN
jgi:uncharacterized protein YbjT (DUF2867 family)